MQRRGYLWLAEVMMVASMIGGTFSIALPRELKDPLAWLFIELTTACLVFTMLYVLIISAAPKRVKPSDIFTGGAAEPPYISAEELYSTKIPHLGDFDEKWEFYRDREVFES